MEGKHVRFTQLLETHLNKVIKKEFDNRDLDPVTLRSIRERLKEQIGGIFGKMNSHKISEHVVMWLTDQYFKAIKVDDDYDMSEMVFINEYKLADLPYHDIELLRNLYSSSTAPWAEELEVEYRGRSQS